MTEQEEVIRIYFQVLKGQRKRFPAYFFVGEQGKKYLAIITRYLIQDYLRIPVEQIPKQIYARILWKYRLRPAAQLYGWNFIEVIQNAYPNQFQPFEFNQVSHGYWQGENGQKKAVEAIRYVIEIKCRIPLHKIPLKINNYFLKEEGLGGILSLFGDSPYQVINTAYPGQFKPWEFSNVPMNCWKNPNHVKEAMHWFLFQKLHFNSYEKAVQQLQKKHFYQHRLTGLFQMAFDSSLGNVKKWIREQMENEIQMNEIPGLDQNMVLLHVEASE